jgi:hypothetical protein
MLNVSVGKMATTISKYRKQGDFTEEAATILLEQMEEFGTLAPVFSSML